ncbi:MAG TPA: chromate transporter [Ktedonobacterales bacterium]|jgi:chromate transporter
MSQSVSRPGAWQLLSIWARIGLQSFGGGATTTLLIQRTFIEQRGWLTIEEFTHLWNLCLFTPGINLVAMTVLIGKKLGGVPGIIVSLAGMLLPSAAITCLLTALFVQIAPLPAVQAVLRGIVPATGGIMLLVGLNFAQPFLRKGPKAGTRFLAIGSLLIIGSTLTIIIAHISVIVIILGAAFVGGLFLSSQQATPLQADEQKDQQ